MNQIELHKKIDELLRKDSAETGRQDVFALISSNPDARQYFYTKADERWLDWLWENGFLDVIKEKAEDPTRYGGRKFPELDYLVKVAEKASRKVVDIMLKVPISADYFNPGVIDRFLWICSALPAGELARIVPQIRNKKWIQLMGAFNNWGFEYEKMLKTLADANDHENILLLAEAILTVRSKEEVSEEGFAGISTENPFYFKDLFYTKVFERLASVSDEYAERALGLTIKVMSQIVRLGDDAEKGEVFPIKETFHLFDVDFFTLELGEKERLSHRDDIRELAAVIKQLARKTIGSYDTDPWRAQELYKKYLEPLPDSRSMWRLRLFVLTLYPEYFKDELKEAFFRLFDVERYYNELISGTEYLKALRIGFPVLSDTDKCKYVKQVIDYFTKKDQEKENEKEDWHIRYGSRILSVITDQLSEEEKQTAKEAGFTLKHDYEPEPSIGTMRGGTVVPRGPITKEEFGNLPIADIAKKLRDEWTPEKLSKQNKSDDFLNPLNAEGVGELLRIDIAKRLQDYVNNANLFFERNVLDQHYTYSFLRGIQEILRGNKADAGNINWDNLIALCTAIKESGEVKPFDNEKRERDSFDAWLSGWTGVHSAMTDVIQELLSEEKGIKIDFPKYRNDLFGIIGCLLSYSDPIPADEEPKTATMTTTSPGAKEQMVSDPYSMAINTVRGRAFQAFTLFMYQDGKRFAKEEKSKISPDVKELYETILKNEKTRALMFMFGHYLPSFYFRDIEWIRGLLPHIFPEELIKKDLYLAAWEGYLANNLYQEIFFDPDIQKLYERGIALAPEEYTKRRYFREIDEGLAIHIALAFMHYEEFGFDHPLFTAFWKHNLERHAKFISFIGRSLVSGDNVRADALLKENPRSGGRLQEFWDWALEHCKNSKSLTEFGFWINTEKEIFDIPWLAEHIRKTLEKTNGVLDWDYGLMKSITTLAKFAPSDTLAILRLLLLEAGVRSKQLRMLFSMDNEWFEAFKILYANPKTKYGVYTLIDDLIREGGSMFWKLKEVIEGN